MRLLPNIRYGTERYPERMCLVPTTEDPFLVQWHGMCQWTAEACPETGPGCCRKLLHHRVSTVSARMQVVCHMSSEATCGRSMSQYSIGVPGRRSAQAPDAAIWHSRVRLVLLLRHL
jgi:hypothetical protein